MANLNITKLFDSGLNLQRRQRKAAIEKIHLKPYRKSELFQWKCRSLIQCQHHTEAPTKQYKVSQLVQENPLRGDQMDGRSVNTQRLNTFSVSIIKIIADISSQRKSVTTNKSNDICSGLALNQSIIICNSHFIALKSLSSLNFTQTAKFLHDVLPISFFN